MNLLILILATSVLPGSALGWQNQSPSVELSGQEQFAWNGQVDSLAEWQEPVSDTTVSDGVEAKRARVQAFGYLLLMVAGAIITGAILWRYIYNRHKQELDS